MARFIQIAMGSASELEYHYLLASDLGMLDETEYRQLQSDLTEVRKMLASLFRTINSSARNG